MSQMMNSGGGSQPNKKPVSISQDDLFLLTGGYNTTANRQAQLFSTRLSPTETVSNVKRVHTKQETNDKLDQQSIISFVQPGHEKISSVKFDSKRFRILAPEIENAALILISSILSPNDLQNTGLQFTIEHDKLPDVVKDQIIEELQRYYNDTYNIGNKLADWCKQCLFGAGSQPVLTLPDIKFDELKNGVSGVTATTESYGVSAQETLKSSIDKIISTPVYTDISGLESLKVKPEDFLVASFESLSQPEKDTYLKPIVLDIETALADEIEKLYPVSSMTDKTDIKEVSNARKKFMTELNAAVEDTTIQITTKMNDGDTFRITENPEILRFHNNFSVKRKYDLTKKLDKFYGIDEQNKVYKHDPIAAISEEVANEGAKTRTFPTIMVLPPESIIPVCIPGDQKTHIGYFIILDQFGHPIISTEPPLDNTVCGDGNGAISFDALFGSRNMRTLGALSNASKGVVASKVFEHILDKFLKAKINDIGLGDMDITQLSDITQVMFRRLMYHKQTVLIFVPETFLTYYAFDYRDDGTGKGKLEDASFILHLRTVYLIAKILAMQKNAINQQTISFDITDKTANPEQLIEQIRNAYISRNATAFNANPTDIVRTISDQSLRFVSKNGLPGIENFSVEDGSSAGRVEAPDDQLLDTLNTLWTDYLDVPHSAMNMMGENEYARSIVANHLFFAKKILNYQEILNPHNDKFVRVNTKYAKPLRNSIAKILNTSGASADKVDTVTGGDAGKISIDEIIDSIYTSLPTPKIAPETAKLTEIKSYMDNIDTVIDRIISEDMIPNGGSDQELKDAVASLKAFYKSKLTQEFAEKVGIDNIFELPSLENTLDAQTGLTSMYQIGKNLRQMIKAMSSALDATKKPEEEFASDTSGGDMGMGMGDDMGMGDMGGDLGSMGDMGGSDMGMGDDMGSMPDMSSGDTSGGDTGMEDPNNTEQPKEEFNFDFSDK